MESEEILLKIEGYIKGVEGCSTDFLRRLTKMTHDIINSIREFINGKPQTSRGMAAFLK